MKTVWKFELIGLRPTVKMPEGAKVLSVQVQGEALCLWAEVDPTRPMVEFYFAHVVTGGNVPTNHQYIGTVLFDGGSYVAHIYQRK